ncbi:MAG: DNA recombination protein RmuC, partial [Burkholderiales bacterium]
MPRTHYAHNPVDEASDVAATYRSLQGAGTTRESCETMMNVELGIAFAVGLAVGASAAAVLFRRRGATARQLAADALKNFEAESQRLLDAAKTAFSALSREALSANADDFLKLAKTKLEQQTTHTEQVLDNKKQLIDARLEEMTGKLTTLNTLLQTVERERAASHGSLEAKLEKTTQATLQLQDTTTKLRTALSNPQVRGQWGERMAEDLLRFVGFVEGVNYEKQKIVASGNRPDYTFFLPDGKKVHMDVKFPLGNYLKVLEAPGDHAREQLTLQFLRDVRNRIKEVCTREYIDPANGTVDYVLVFIPNEQVYGFIHEHDRTLLDDSLRQKVVLCSPLTLYAILAVIRQAVDNFRFEHGAKQILQVLADFRKQWAKYVETMERLGKRLDDALGEYQ